MKRNAFIVILLGIAIVVAAAAVAGCAGGSTTPSPTPKPVKTSTDILEKYDALKSNVNASGYWYGGAVTGEDTAMVYIYRPAGVSDMSDVISTGFKALYTVFPTEDSLIVGLVDTSQKISDTQYKVDYYSLDRPAVELFTDGSITKTELVNKAKILTADNINSNNGTASPTASATALPPRSKNYTAPADRQAYSYELLNRSGYQVADLQGGTTTDGLKVVKLQLVMSPGLSIADKYKEIGAAIDVFAGAFGDCDQYYLTMGTQTGNEYYFISTDALPVVDYVNGDISQNDLYNNMNMMYVTS
jgi:hypothetical protein